MDIFHLVCNSDGIINFQSTLDKIYINNGWIQLHNSLIKDPILTKSLLPKGPGIIIESGGSAGGKNWCFQPLSHLDRSAFATSRWLKEIGIKPNESLLFNPLPMHHVSGLMPLWRSLVWGAKYFRLTKEIMRDFAKLNESSKRIFSVNKGPGLLSLVPTQLSSLLNDSNGILFLKQFEVIWVGGAELPIELANKARDASIRISPCYGATETTAMIAALEPNKFLSGEHGCGNPMSDVKLRVGEQGRLEVQTSRLAVGRWSPFDSAFVKPLEKCSGWWLSGDLAEFSNGLRILGRCDGAILSGGEIVFPDILEKRLRSLAYKAKLPLSNILIISIADAKWGERIVALVKASKPELGNKLIEDLKKVTSDWEPAERPICWRICQGLAVNEIGKFQRGRWKHWLADTDFSSA